MRFIDEKHAKFYFDTINHLDSPNVHQKALCYCLGLSHTTRSHINEIYNFDTNEIIPECLLCEWQTSGSLKITRMAFNLYCNGVPSITDEMSTESKIEESACYNVDDLFCCNYAPFFWEAVKIRYPEYTTEIPTDNYEKILCMSRTEMIDFINMLIDDGDHRIPDDLWNVNKEEDTGSNQQEVSDWLSLNTL